MPQKILFYITRSNIIFVVLQWEEDTFNIIAQTSKSQLSPKWVMRVTELGLGTLIKYGDSL